MDVALDLWDDDKRTIRKNHKRTVAKTVFERLLLVAGLFALLHALVEGRLDRRSLFGAGLIAAVHRCQDRVFPKDKGLLRRLALQRLQILAHVLTVGWWYVVWPDKQNTAEFALGVWAPVFILEVGSHKTDIEGAVAMMHAVLHLAAWAVAEREVFPYPFLALSHALDVPIACWKLVKLYHHGCATLDATFVCFVCVHLLLAIVVWANGAWFYPALFAHVGFTVKHMLTLLL